jgi:hypothetical protein
MFKLDLKESMKSPIRPYYGGSAAGLVTFTVLSRIRIFTAERQTSPERQPCNIQRALFALKANIE